MAGNWTKILVSPSTTILRTVEVIDQSKVQIALVVDEQNRLKGTVTDGDIRRGLLRGIPLSDPVEKVMNQNPVTARHQETRAKIIEKMTVNLLRHIPILDEEGRLAGIERLESLLTPESRDNWVVLMAGGLGTRLRPLTENCPKPLLTVGNKPLLETTLENFTEHGFRKFFVSVNYMAEMIEGHFGDGAKWNVDIQYLHENEPLGTAGALRLLPARPDKPIFVMNGDLLTKVNFEQLLKFHEAHGAVATMCVREYDFQVPYGVVRLEGERIQGIDEKPVQRFFVNAGIYILSPEALNVLPTQGRFDMPSLFQALIKKGKVTAAFPIREYWMDIGQLSDFERANGDFPEVFR